MNKHNVIGYILIRLTILVIAFALIYPVANQYFSTHTLGEFMLKVLAMLAVVIFLGIMPIAFIALCVWLVTYKNKGVNR